MTADARPAGPPAVISPVARPVPLRQSVYEALVELVVSGRLRPGEHLVETELARQLGVSRQPVREALHRLDAEGWVDLRPNQGAFVHVPTDHEVDELLDVRELLEVQIARLAARSASPAGIAQLRAIWYEGQSAVTSGETERVVAANSEFHGALARAAGNAVLADLARIVSRRVRWYYRQVALIRGQESWVEHRELIDAVEAKDEERAAEIAGQHTDGARSAYHQLPPVRLAPLRAGLVLTSAADPVAGVAAMPHDGVTPGPARSRHWHGKGTNGRRGPAGRAAWAAGARLRRSWSRGPR